VRASDLTGEARRLYETWREVGYTDAQALEEVDRSGILVEQQLIETYQRRGMSPEAAAAAARGRNGTSATLHPFDRLTEAYRRAGMSPEAARLAAIGRNGRTEAEARQTFAEVFKPLQESARPVSLLESSRLTEATGGKPGSGRWRAKLIAGDVQGSSGYYSAQMLKECAGVFRQGLPMFIDHPSVTEAYERPERSVRDLAGRLVTPATYEGDGLYSTIEVFPQYAPMVEAMADHIGLSIRASGEVKPSMTESVRGPIVTAITAAESVDLVTAAGAGGRIVTRAA
jgi:hypothetical protein